MLTSHQRWCAAQALDARAHAYAVLQDLLRDDEVQQLLQVNRYQGVLWFKREAFEQTLWWLLVVAAVRIVALQPPIEAERQILTCYKVIQQLRQAEEESGYRVEELLRLAGEITPARET